MPKPATVLERAFEMAQTGNYAGMGEIREALQGEGYTTSQLVGPSLQQQLRALCQKAKGIKPVPPVRRGRRGCEPADRKRLTYYQKLTQP